jgi:hypothetical protein
VFENLVWRRFRPKRAGVTGVWRKLCNEELHNHHQVLLGDKIKQDEISRAYVACLGHIRNVGKIMVIEPKEKRPCINRLQDDTKVYFEEI